jgi:hypothetical protein
MTRLTAVPKKAYLKKAYLGPLTCVSSAKGIHLMGFFVSSFHFAYRPAVQHVVLQHPIVRKRHPVATYR